MGRDSWDQDGARHLGSGWGWTAGVRVRLGTRVQGEAGNLVQDKAGTRGQGDAEWVEPAGFWNLHHWPCSLVSQLRTVHWDQCGDLL